MSSALDCGSKFCIRLYMREYSCVNTFEISKLCLSIKDDSNMQLAAVLQYSLYTVTAISKAII